MFSGLIVVFDTATSISDRLLLVLSIFEERIHKNRSKEISNLPRIVDHYDHYDSFLYFPESKKELSVKIIQKGISNLPRIVDHYDYYDPFVHFPESKKE